MNKIIMIIPYFGTLPSNFSLWLKSCSCNPNIDFLLFTDDKKNFLYPNNVKVIYTNFDSIKIKIQKLYNFKICIDRPWRISFFKPAYGEIFKEYIQGYEFWGYCDVDLLWGKIDKFITNDILNKYDRICNKGHFTLYKNNVTNNTRYKTIVPDRINYIDVFSGKNNFSFDENGMDYIYKYLNIPYYSKEINPNYAHLEKYEPGFYLNRLDEDKKITNKYQIFLWNKGHLYRYYLENKILKNEEYMYIHFFCRPMKYVCGLKEDDRYIIYPDIVKPFYGNVNSKLVKNKGKQSKITFYIKMLCYNRKKISILRIKNNIKYFLEYKHK